MVSRLQTAFGIVLAVTPVTLWIAWTPAVFAVVVAVAAISAALLVLLHESQGAAAEDAQPRPVLPDEFVDEVHRLFPLTYHHSLVEPARYRAAMRRLRRLL